MEKPFFRTAYLARLLEMLLVRGRELIQWMKNPKTAITFVPKRKWAEPVFTPKYACSTGFAAKGRKYALPWWMAIPILRLLRRLAHLLISLLSLWFP